MSVCVWSRKWIFIWTSCFKTLNPFVLNRICVLRQIYVNAVGICEGHCIINGPATIALSFFWGGGGYALFAHGQIRFLATVRSLFLQSMKISICLKPVCPVLLRVGVFNLLIVWRRHLNRTEQGGPAWSTHEEMRDTHKILVGKCQKKRPLEKPMHRWPDNIQIDLTKIF